MSPTATTVTSVIGFYLVRRYAGKGRRSRVERHLPVEAFWPGTCGNAVDPIEAGTLYPVTSTLRTRR